MRAKILVSAMLAAVVAAFAFAPMQAQARGDVVSVPGSYMPGTIVIRTNERALYYFVGVGQAIRYPVGVGRIGMQWTGSAVYRRQIYQAGMVTARFHQEGLQPASTGDPGRLAAKSNGRCGNDPFGWRAIRHSRHQQ